MLRILSSIFGKGFAKHAVNSEKIKFDIKFDRFTKSFPFQDIYICLKILLKFWHFYLHGLQIPPRQFCDLVSSMNYSEYYFTHMILKHALRFCL